MAARLSALEVFSIPELLDIVQGNLSPHDLAQCVLVSSEFSALFTPLLWHTVSLTTLQQHVRFTSSVDVQTALLRNSKFVRVIRVWTCKSLRPFMAVKAQDLSSLAALEFTWLSTHVGHATSLTEGVARSAIRDTTNERVAWTVGRHEVKRQHTFSMHGNLRRQVLHELYRVRSQVEDGPSQSSCERYQHRKRLLQLQSKEVLAPVIPIWQRPDIVPPPSVGEAKLYEDPKDEQLLIVFLSYFLELKIFMSTSLLFFNPEVIKVLGARLGQMQYLSLTLDDFGSNNRYESLKHLLNQGFPFLKRLRLMFATTKCAEEILSLDQAKSGAGGSSSTSEVAAAPILSMKSLMVEDIVYFPQSIRTHPQTWLPFIKRCINLTSLTLGQIRPTILHEVASIISESCPLIEDLAVGCIGTETRTLQHPTDQNLSSLFAACSARTEEEIKYPATVSISPILKLTSTKRSTGLKQVRLYGISIHVVHSTDSTPFSHTITPLEALNRHVDCLTHLDFDSIMAHDKGELFMRIVQTFSKLEVLNALPYARLRSNRNKGGLNAGLLVDSIVAGQWACAETLRVLKVNINGLALSDRALPVPAPTHTTVTPVGLNNIQDDVEPFAAALDTLAGLMRTRGVEPTTLQQYVCQQLNTLTSLQELCLGVEPTDELDFRECLHGVQEDCLELSLESGLDRMEDLRELRVFSVMRMKHKIRLEEVKWMVAKWPKLEAVPGLLSSCCYNDTEDEKQVLQDEEQHIIHWIKENKPLLRYLDVTPPKGSLQERSKF